MIALTFEGNDKREHEMMFNNDEEITSFKIALETAGFQVTRIRVVDGI